MWGADVARSVSFAPSIGTPSGARKQYNQSMETTNVERRRRALIYRWDMPPMNVDASGAACPLKLAPLKSNPGFSI